MITEKRPTKSAGEPISLAEFKAWLDLQEAIVQGQVLVSILDNGNGLFELIDADHDGSLSIRELRSIWNHLKSSGCVGEGGFGRKKLPRQLLGTISQGQPQTTIGKPVRLGPQWFRSMDRNSDGDLSRREFLGRAEIFNQYDLDRDGLLSPQEATNAGNNANAKP